MTSLGLLLLIKQICIEIYTCMCVHMYINIIVYTLRNNNNITFMKVLLNGL